MRGDINDNPESKTIRFDLFAEYNSKQKSKLDLILFPNFWYFLHYINAYHI